MYGFSLIIVAFLVGPSLAFPVGFGLPNNYYQPCYGPDPCNYPYGDFGPFPQVGGVYPAPALGSDFYPTDLGFNYPYVNPRQVSVAHENYARNYGFGSTEVGVRDQVSVRSNAPGFYPPYSRICVYLPVCFRGVNRYPQRFPYEYDVAF